MMKNRGTSVCNHCKQKLKSPVSLQSSSGSRACGCQRGKSKKKQLKNSSRYSDKSNSQSRCQTNPIYQSVNHNIPAQFISQDPKSPVQYIDMGNNLTNLRIQGCEFPAMQTARNNPTGNLLQTDNLNNQRLSQFQQPNFNTLSFNNLSQAFQTMPHPQHHQNHQYNSTTQSPFRQTNFESLIQHHTTSQMRQFSPGQKDFNTLTPTKQIYSHYDRIISEFELYSKQRAVNLREGLQKIVEGLKTDDIINTMREDSSSQNYIYQRMKEVVENQMLTESEQVIGNLRSEIVLLREKILILEADNQQKISKTEIEKIEKKVKHELQRKNHYKQQLKQSQDQIGQLLSKFKQVEQEILKQQTDFEVKIGQKDGELARCDQVLQELRNQLQDKSTSQNKLESNLSNEMTFLNERIINLEKEKSEMLLKYQKYGEDFQGMMVEEQKQHQSKVEKYKNQIKELRINIDQQNNTQKQLEIQIQQYLKEIEQHKLKIDELSQQSQDKNFKLKDIEDKHILQEKDLSSQLKEQKNKYKAKMKQLQQSFEQVLQEKLHQIENEAKDQYIKYENEKREIEIKFSQMQQSYEQKSEEDKQNLIIMQKQTEKKIEKLQTKYEQEIQTKLLEVEEQFKELEQKLRKEHKNEKKLWAQQKEQEQELQQNQVQEMQERYESEFRDISLKLREEIDVLQKAAQEQRIKIAEQNILIDSHKSETERLSKENENLLSQQRELIIQNKREVQLLEEKLQQKIQENDDKVKIALDSAIKNSNLEAISKQYQNEIDKKQSEVQMLKDQLVRINNKYDKQIDEQKQLLSELQNTKQIIYDKDFKICRLQSVNKEAFTKIFQFVRLQSGQYKQELDYLKRQFTYELEMNKKQIESQLLGIISKAREVSYTQKFKLEKLQYHYEQRFQKEFNSREIEWEKIWEKREDQIQQKEQIIKNLEIEKSSLKETIIRQEGEINSLKTQLQNQKSDYQKQLDEMKTKLKINEQKHNEMQQQLKKQEEQLIAHQRQQMNDLKIQMQQKSQEELKKLETQMNEYRDKSKQKINDLAQHIQENQTKHRQELISMKQIYEEKIKTLECDNDDKQRVLYESQNKINMLQIKYEQFIKDNELMEKQIIELSQKEKELSMQVVAFKSSQDTLTKENEELSKSNQIYEKEIKDLDTQNRTLQTQIYTVERKLVQQKNDLKRKMRKLHQSKQRELQEVQFLSDILTRNPTSATKLQRDRSVASPDFQRNLRPSQSGLQTFRGMQSQRLNQTQSNYGDILSEINNMIDAKQCRLSSSNFKSFSGQQSQRFHNIISSPSVGQVNPLQTFTQKSILKSPSNKYNDENTHMRVSELQKLI